MHADNSISGAKKFRVFLLEDDFQEIGPDGLKKVGWIRFEVSSNFSSSSLTWSDL